MRRTLLPVLAVVLLVPGCGGGQGSGGTKERHAHAARSGPRSEAEREERERRQVPGKRLVPADRVAYYQIATTSGLLRARAATVLSGLRGTPRGTLSEGRQRLARLTPKSSALVLLRDRLAAAIDALMAHESPAAARRALGASRSVNAALQRFSKGKAVRLLVPD